MSGGELIVCATCGEAKPANKMYSKGKRVKPALCDSCYYKMPETRAKANEYAAKHRQKIEAKEYMRKYMKGYKERPEVVNRYKQWWLEYRKSDKCKNYQSEYHRREYYKERQKEYRRLDYVIQRRRNDQSRKSYQIEYKKRPIFIEYEKAKRLIDAKTLSDAYVKNVIRKQSKCMLRFCEIPSEIVQLKRQSIALKRIINQKQQENDEHSTTQI